MRICYELLRLSRRRSGIITLKNFLKFWSIEICTNLRSWENLQLFIAKEALKQKTWAQQKIRVKHFATIMKPVITVRRFEDHDNHQVQSVIRNFVLSRFSAAFWFCLFREVNFSVLKVEILNINCFSFRSHCSLQF